MVENDAVRKQQSMTLPVPHLQPQLLPSTPHCPPRNTPLPQNHYGGWRAKSLVTDFRRCIRRWRLWICGAFASVLRQTIVQGCLPQRQFLSDHPVNFFLPFFCRARMPREMSHLYCGCAADVCFSKRKGHCCHSPHVVSWQISLLDSFFLPLCSC